ncbi:hypothetical protein PV326_012460 [Microctonus aethiopoides]|nr:hypothetical protein PV326_012460 [Microctonus aethiopoides]
MEADVGAELLTRSTILKETNLNVKIVVGDEDSSLMSAVNKLNCGNKIYKLADMNHIKKNLSKKLYSLQAKHKFLCKKGLIQHIKKCFSYAISQNKGDSVGLARNVRCIPHHLFNKHDDCGTWCKTKNNTSSDYNQQTFIVKDINLYGDLQLIFNSYADNAFKYCISASSQANEAFNHSVTRKFPKNKNFSMSSSGDTRVACAVLAKNDGNSYLKDVKKSLNLDVSNILIKSTKVLDQKRETKYKKALTIDKKKRRIELAQKRENLRKTMEKNEGLTYQCNIGFDKDYSLMTDHKNIDKNKITIVVYDLETSGRSKNSDILQIAAIAHKQIFSVYIRPTQPIDESASKVNGLKNIHGDLYLHDEKLSTLTMIEALQSFYSFLNMICGTCILVAHNATFDTSFLLREIIRYSLENEYSNIIYGFADSLKLLRRKFPERQGNGMFKLSKLAEDLLQTNLCTENFHEAIYDGIVLQDLLNKYLTADDLFDHAITFVESLKDFINKFKVATKEKSLLPMKDIVSKYMMKKLARMEITYDQLKEIYKSGEDSLLSFLSQKVDKQPRVTKDKTVLKNIVEHFRFL